MYQVERVVIASANRMLSDGLQRILGQQADAAVVGRTEFTDTISLLLALRETDATVLVLTGMEIVTDDACPHRPQLLPHLFAEVPGLTVMHFDESRNQLTSYRQRIVSNTHDVHDIHDIASLVRGHQQAA